MTDSSATSAHIDEALEREATSVLSEIGLTVPDAVRLMLARVVEERRLPFDLKPNELTAETLRRSERGEDVVYAEDAATLFRDLGM